MSLDLANQIASATVAACAAGGYAVTATVVDRAGTVRAVQRADNAGPHTLAASIDKALTSASAKNATLAMMEARRRIRPPPTWCTFRASCCWAAACRSSRQRDHRRRRRRRRAGRPPGRAVRDRRARQGQGPTEVGASQKEQAMKFHPMAEPCDRGARRSLGLAALAPPGRGPGRAHARRGAAYQRPACGGPARRPGRRSRSLPTAKPT